MESDVVIMRYSKYIDIFHKWRVDRVSIQNEYVAVTCLIMDSELGLKYLNSHLDGTLSHKIEDERKFAVARLKYGI